MRAEVQGTEDIDGDFAVETKAVEAHGGDFVAIFVESANLRYEMNLSNNFITGVRIDATEISER